MTLEEEDNDTDADTDNIYLTEEEWLQVIREVRFANTEENLEMTDDVLTDSAEASDNNEETEDDRAYPSHCNDNSELDETIWLGDTGASTHMTMSLIGMYELKDFKGTVTVGNGEKMQVTKIGTTRGIVVQQDGVRKSTTLRQVKYVPDLNCNLLSLTQVLEAGFEMIGDKNGLKIKKGRMT